MLKKYLFVLFFFNIFLFSKEKSDPYITATISSEQSSIIGGCVNVITGDFIFNSTDLIAFGEEPISKNHKASRQLKEYEF